MQKTLSLYIRPFLRPDHANIHFLPEHDALLQEFFYLYLFNVQKYRKSPAVRATDPRDIKG